MTSNFTLFGGTSSRHLKLALYKAVEFNFLPSKSLLFMFVLLHCIGIDVICRAQLLNIHESSKMTKFASKGLQGRQS